MFGFLGSTSSTGLAWDPYSPHTLAIGVDDPYVRLYDVRMVRAPSGAAGAAGRQQAQEVARLRGPPATLLHCGVSSLEFSRDRPGLLLANYRDADVYLFHTNKLEPESEVESLSHNGDVADAMAGAAGDSADDADSESGSRVDDAPLRGTRQSRQTLGSRGIQREPDVIPCMTTVLRGRRNSETFAKDASFVLGDAWVATGGDCGNLFVWNVDTGVSLSRVHFGYSLGN